ncbi:PAS domain-containing sensor histidine kinase [Methanocella arvoryzae]|nr:PAS domain-containing sensor histidine kinase [Methanocella arvoryzae]
MVAKPGSRKMSDNTRLSVDVEDKDRLITELHQKIQLLEKELQSKQEAARPPDNAELKRVEELLQKSEANLAKLQELAHIGNWELGVQTIEISCSAESNRIFGLEPVKTNINYNTFLDFIVPEDREQVDGAIRSSIETGEVYSVTYRIKRNDGVCRVIQSYCEAIKDASGRVINIYGTTQDITDPRQPEEALLESEEKFRMVADSANTGILLIQGEDIVYVNQALAGMFGYTVEECNHLKYWNLAPPDRREFIRWAGNARQQGWLGPSRTELKMICKNGEDIWLDCSWSVPMLRGKPAVLVMCVDITARKRAESEVLKAKAQAELYLDLMGHDINNLNQIAQGYLEMALYSLDIAPAQKDLIEKPLEALKSSSRIIANVRKLQKAEMGGFPSKTVDICSVLADLKTSYSSMPERTVTIDFDHACPCYVPANELIVDVFSNILGNAIKHSDPQKPLNIDMGIENVIWDEKNYFRIMIADNGPGIPDDLKEKLFSRFTKGETRSRGKGLGLYIARTLVQSFHGKIWVEDRVHGDYTKGTRFVILLPVA